MASVYNSRMSWLYDKVPEEIIDRAEAVEYHEQVHAELRMDGALKANERIDSMEDVRALIGDVRCTMEVREKILFEVFEGAYPEEAAAAAGVPTATLNEWLQMGVKGVEPFKSFYIELMKMEAQGLAEIRKRLKSNPDNDKFLLERRGSRPLIAEAPRAGGPRWRKQGATEIQITAPAASAETDVSKLTNAQRKSLLAQLSQNNHQAALPAAEPPQGMEIMDKIPQKDVIDGT